MTEMSDLEDVAQRYKRATDALDTVRTEMQTTAVALLQQDGVKQADVARVTGWSREHLRRLKEKAELESLRRKVDELSAAKKPNPAVAAPRRQVTRTVTETPEEPDPPDVSPPVAALPYGRVTELAEAAKERHPEWVEQIRQAHPDADGQQMHYLIVEAGFRKGFKIPDLAVPAKPERADRPVPEEEAAEFATLARSRASEMQLAKLEQLAGYAADGVKDYAVMHAGLSMGLLTHNEVYAEPEERPVGSEETSG